MASRQVAPEPSANSYRVSGQRGSVVGKPAGAQATAEMKPANDAWAETAPEKPPSPKVFLLPPQNTWGVEDGDTQMKDVGTFTKRYEHVKAYAPWLTGVVTAGVVAGGQAWAVYSVQSANKICHFVTNTI